MVGWKVVVAVVPFMLLGTVGATPSRNVGQTQPDGSIGQQTDAHLRTRRQISQALHDILSSPYSGPKFDSMEPFLGRLGVVRRERNPRPGDFPSPAGGRRPRPVSSASQFSSFNTPRFRDSRPQGNLGHDEHFRPSSHFERPSERPSETHFFRDHEEEEDETFGFSEPQEPFSSFPSQRPFRDGSLLRPGRSPPPREPPRSSFFSFNPFGNSRRKRDVTADSDVSASGMKDVFEYGLDSDFDGHTSRMDSRTYHFYSDAEEDLEEPLRNARNNRNNKDQLISDSHKIVARKMANPSDQPHSRVPRHHLSAPNIHISSFGRANRPISLDVNRAAKSQPRSRSSGAEETSDLLSQDQRLFSSFSKRIFPSSSFRESGRFFRNGPHPPGPPLPLSPQLPRGIIGSPNSFSRRPGLRGRGPHDDFHDEPKFKHPSHSFNDFHPVDNSILGSGNFEVIRGGTFYDHQDPHLNHNPFDHFLDDDFGHFHDGGPHSNNHVDDFFSNFRDFSEFATRRSGSDGPYVNDGNFASGYASEQIPSLIGSNYGDDMMTSESKGTSVTLQPKKSKYLENSKFENSKFNILTDGEKRKKKQKFIETQKTKTKSKEADIKNKRPKNIQDVLRLLEESPPDTISNNGDTEDDPLIAVF